MIFARNHAEKIEKKVGELTMTTSGLPILRQPSTTLEIMKDR